MQCANGACRARAASSQARLPPQLCARRRPHAAAAVALAAPAGARCARASVAAHAAASSSGDAPSTSARAAAPAAAAPLGEDIGYMREYANLKAELLDNTRKAGGVLGVYLLLTAGGGPALCCMVGAASSYAYFSWLCADVDAVKGTDRVPIWEANKIENPLLRRGAKLAAAYRASLRPRLLVPVGLAAGVGAWNALSGAPLPLLYEGCMMGGFLAYKGALLTKMLQELLPKSYSSESDGRPKLEVIEDELDQWGRPKKAARTPIDALPADAQAQALQQLEKQQGGGGGGEGGSGGGRDAA